MNVASIRNRILGICLALGAVMQVQAQSYDPSVRTANATDPRMRAKVHTELGAAYFQGGHPSAALDELRIALEADSSYFQALSVRGLVHASLREYAKAEDDFKRALKMAPGDPEVNNNYGWYLCETGKEQQSIAYFMQAIKDPLYETPDRAYTNAGTCAMKAGDLDAALNYLLNALRLAHDGAVQTRFQLASLFYRRGNYTESEVYLKDVFRMVDMPSAAMFWLGLRVERKLGNRAVEANYAAQLRSRYPGSPEYMEFLKGNFE